MINFPLYGMRKYTIVEPEKGYKIIQTYRSRYVLDSSSNTSNYFDRRMEMLGEDLPYPLYPLNKRIEKIHDILEAKTRLFIDALGNTLLWKPAKSHMVKCHKIKSKWQLQNSRWIIEADGCKFEVKDGDFKYAQLVHIGSSRILFNLLNEKVKDTRRKL